MAKRCIKWCDYIRKPSELLTDVTPVFMFAEGRGSKYDHYTNRWSPERLSDEALVKIIRHHICGSDEGQDQKLGKVEVRDYIGRDYIAMEWKDRRYFFKAMESFLLRGIGVFTQSRLCINLPLKWYQGEVLTPDVAERMHYLDITDTSQYSNITQEEIVELSCRAWPYTHTNSWVSDYGKKIVNLVKKHRYVNEESDDETILCELCDDKKEEIEVKAQEEAVEDEECMICLDRKPDTKVTEGTCGSPCQHQVVCSSCSENLTNTPDKNICVRCRRKITGVELV